MRKILAYIVLALLSGTAFADLTTTSTAAVQSGEVDDQDTTYLTARNNTVGDATSASFSIGQLFAGGTTYQIFRTVAVFPSIPAMTACSACTLFIDGNGDNSATDFTIHIYGARTWKSTRTTADYNKFSNWAASGTYDSTKVLNTAWHSSSYLAGYNAIIFNSTGRDSLVASTGDSLWVALLSNRDVRADVPTGNEYIDFEGAGGTNKPYISFTYTLTVVSSRSVLYDKAITPYLKDGVITPSKR